MTNHSEGVFENAPQNNSNRRTWIIVGCAGLAVMGCICLIFTGLGAALMRSVGLMGANDNLDTTQVETITVGSQASGIIGDTLEAHNWLFEGSAGQRVSIQVLGDGTSDPRARLIAPDGSLVDSDDDGGGNLDAYISTTLPATGTYTIRIDLFEVGEYTLILN